MTRDRLDDLLGRISLSGVAVMGDFCMDAYWTVDRTLSEVSVETGRNTVPIRAQRYSLGGAGNIVANLSALGLKDVLAIGVIGDDLFGREMIRDLKAVGADASGMVEQDAEWSTPVYGKPYAGEEEEPRIDFGVYNRISSSSEQAVLSALESALARVHAVIVNQQLPRGIVSENVIRGVNDLVARFPKKIFVVDSRDYSEHLKGVVYRLNGREAARICGMAIPPDQDLPLDDARRFAGSIFDASGKPVFISRGARGSIVRWSGGTEIVPGIQILKQTDPVGAGDTSVSAIAGALAAGATPVEAAVLANFASAVTVRKLRITGTASPDEIRGVGADPDYIFRPELAGDPRAARFHDGTEIEIVSDSAIPSSIRHAVFDHDGTISTLRQGWEPIMEKMFVRVILGPRYETADEAVYRRVAERVRDYISRSTGIRTMSQMEALAEMVRDLGFVESKEVLDPSSYKRIYLKALMEKVSQRIAKLGREELDMMDFTVKGAVSFLDMLRKRGVRLYLASGTDHEDVKAEAAALGYAHLFDGGIYGASDDMHDDVKRAVIGRILNSRDLAGSELVCFGDGPVELRETKRRGGMAVGVASDEVRRYGLNEEKRSRLICAGADAVIPDFAQHEALGKFLFGAR